MKSNVLDGLYLPRYRISPNKSPSLIVAPPPEKPLNHDNIMNINFVD